MTISASIIVKNESAHLAACLESLRGHVDEVVVVDTGSSDDSVSTAERFGATVKRSELFKPDTPKSEFHFSKARNEALSLCNGDWILSIDADERLIGNGLGKWLATVSYNYCAIQSKRPEGNRISWLPRVFRNHRGITWEGRYHETPTWDMDSEVRIPDHVAWLSHHGAQTEEKLLWSVAMLKRDMMEIAKNGPAVFRVGDSYRALGPRYYPEAIGYFRLCLDTMPRLQSSMRPYLLYALSDCYSRMGAMRPAIDIATELTRDYPAYQRGWIVLAGCYQKLKEWDIATCYYRRSLEVVNPLPLQECVDEPIDIDAIAECLEYCEQQQNSEELCLTGIRS